MLQVFSVLYINARSSTAQAFHLTIFPHCFSSDLGAQTYLRERPQIPAVPNPAGEPCDEVRAVIGLAVVLVSEVHMVKTRIGS